MLPCRMSRDQRVQDNWAFLHAAEVAAKTGSPVAVAFNLVGLSFCDCFEPSPLTSKAAITACCLMLLRSAVLQGSPFFGSIHSSLLVPCRCQSTWWLVPGSSALC